MPSSLGDGGSSLLNHMFNGSTSVSKELGVYTLERSVSLSFGSLDTISVCLSVLIVVGMVLALCHDI
jgi:hypothetical protein